MPTQTDVSINIGIVSIPDNFASEPGQPDKLRISLLISPTMQGPEVGLADLPAQIWGLCAKLQVALHPNSGELQGTSVAYTLMPAMGEEAGPLWRKMFAAGSQFEHAELARLRLVMLPAAARSDAKHMAATVARRGYARLIEAATTSYDAGRITEVFGGMRDALTSVTMRTRLAEKLLLGKSFSNDGKPGSSTALRMLAESHVPFRQTYARSLLHLLAATQPEKLMVAAGGAAAPIGMADLTRAIQQLQLERQTKGAPGMAAASDPVRAHVLELEKHPLLGTLVKGGEIRSVIQAALESWLLTDRVRPEQPAPMSLPYPHRGGDEILFPLVAFYVIAQFDAAFGEPQGTFQRRDAMRKEGVRSLAAIDRDKDADRMRDIGAKYASIRSNPTFAKALNMIVDIEVDAVAFVKQPKGYLRVAFPGAAAGSSAAVAYYFDLATRTFRPGTSAEFASAALADKALAAAALAAAQRSLPLKNGMVALDDPRFSLGVVDVHTLVNGTKMQIGETHEALKRSSDDSNPARSVEQRGRGIQLLDALSQVPVRAKIALGNAVPSAAPAPPLYAEDLVLGYRVFVRRLPPGGEKPKLWRTLMARKVRIDGLADRYGDWHVHRDTPEREHGYLRPLPRIEKIKGAADNAPDGRAVAPSHVFSWLGDGLGLPPPPSSRRLTQWQLAAERAHVGIGITIGNADPADYLLPVLRCGSAYQFALVPVYLHGGSMTLAQFVANWGKIVPASGAGAPFLYGSPNDVEAPRLLVDDTPLVRNETFERVVLRSGAEQRHSARRYFAPPRVDFERAEQFGMFDKSRADIQQGAFQQFALNPEGGDFPAMETTPGQPGGALLKLREEKRTAALAYFPDPLARNLNIGFERNGAMAPGFPPSSPARAFWSRAGSTNTAECLGALPIEFEVRAGTRGNDAIFLKESMGGMGHGGGRVRFGKLTLELPPAEQVTMYAWCSPDLEMLSRARPAFGALVQHAFAEHDTLMKSLFPKALGAQDDDPLRKLGTVKDYFASIAAGTEPVEVVEARLANGDPTVARLLQERRAAIEQMLFQMHPQNGINGWRTVQLVHAVVKPLAVPFDVQLSAVRLRPDTDFAKWAKTTPHWRHEVDRNGITFNHHDDLNGTTIYLGGHIGFDRASTGAIRIDASWPVLDHALAVVARKVAAVIVYEDRPPRRDQTLLEIKDIPREGGANNSADLLDLLADEKGQLRALMVQAASSGSTATAARHLNIRIVATSRFSDDFTPEPEGRDPGELGKFEVETRLSVNQAEKRKEPLSIEIMVLLPATSRPPVPVVTRIDWIMPEQTWPSCGNRSVTRKSCVPRFFLDPSYRVSGPEELVAVLFAPQGALDDIPVPDADVRKPVQQAGHIDMPPPERWCASLPEQIDQVLSRMAAHETDNHQVDCGHDVNPAHAYVTRWGADPVTNPGAGLELNISPLRFTGYVGRLAKRYVPLAGTPVDATFDRALFGEVQVLLYQPQLDPQSGRWYIDIGIDPGLVHAPFVRLALARYQPEALHRTAVQLGTPPKVEVDLRMSKVLLLDPLRVFAPRMVEIHDKLVGDRREVTTTVHGAGYRARAPAGATPAVQILVNTPLQNIELMRVSRKAGALVPKYDLYGVPMKRSRIKPAQGPKLLAWKCEFTLPVTDDGEQYAITIDEVDLHVSDEEIARLAAKVGSEVPELVERPAMFSLTVRLDAMAT